METYLLGIDNGNTVCKAVLFDLTGREVAVASCKIATYYPQPGWSERNMDELWQVTARTIREVIDRAGIQSKQIVAVGGTGHGNGLYLLDKSGQPLRGIQSLDSRAGPLCQEWTKTGLAEAVYPYTLQAFWAAQSNSLLAWLKRYDRATYQQIGTVLLCKDYINYCLTGEIATDYSDMSATNLIDILNQCYSDELLGLYDLGDIRSALPPMHSSASVMGRVSAAAAAGTGLRAGTPVVSGMLDADASMTGSGVIAEGQACVIAGSWSVNTALTRNPLINPDLAMTAIAAVPGHWVCVEASATSITNLEWFITQFCAEERLEAERRGVSVHVVCDERVAALPVHAESPILYHPFLHGSNVQATARAGLYGLAGWHTRADVLRALYEGIAFGHLSHIEKLRQGGAATFDSARLTGGGARSPVLAQLFADVLGIRMEVPIAQETGALGAAIAAGIGVGVYADYAEAVQQTVRVGPVYHPDPTRTMAYQNRYQDYVQLIESMQPTWDRLADFNR
jgi:L-xylulokinase